MDWRVASQADVADRAPLVNALDQNGEVLSWSGTVDILLTNINVTVDPETVNIVNGTVRLSVTFDTLTMQDEETRIKLRYRDVITELEGLLQIRKVFETYTLTVTDNGHGDTNPSGAVQVDHGVATDIEATADADYAFVNWSVVSGTDVRFDNSYTPSTTVTLTGGDATVRANFAQEVYQLTIGNDGHGTTDPSGVIQVIGGVPTDISAEVTDAGYGFGWWSVEDGEGVEFGDDAEAQTTVTLTVGDVEIQANFAVIPLAEFEADVMTGDDPLEVQFTDLSTGDIDAWEWDFGDESGASFEQHPGHSYRSRRCG